jgi:hypothetical protein
MHWNRSAAIQEKQLGCRREGQKGTADAPFDFVQAGYDPGCRVDDRLS